MLALATRDNDLLFKHLGIDKKKLAFEVERTTGKKVVKEEPQKQTTQGPAQASENPFGEMNTEDAFDFFN